MKEYIAIAVALIWFSSHSYYIRQILRRKIFPTFSTWVIFSAATSLNTASYLAATDKDFASGPLIISDAIICLAVVFTMAFFTNSTLCLKPFEKYYLAAAAGIVAFWVTSGNAFASNLLLQALIAVGYLPTIQNLMQAQKNPESRIVWSLDVFAAAISLYPAMVHGNLLAAIYSIRAVLMLSFVLLLIVRLEIREKLK